jgi:hypothetical protein
VVQACKILKISAEDFEPKSVDDFMKNLHSEYYDQEYGNLNVGHIDIAGLAKIEYDHYEKRR